ncbi:MAG: triose-phosphate isomerase [Elusimicrobia bacterium]|nr:triose-phosphate isomerase [Elusimicrobiota bacterium]
MNKTVGEAVELAGLLKQNLQDVKDREIVICPTYISIFAVKEVIKNSNVKLGAQNMYFEKSGAFTGEVSAFMLKNAGCDYVIIGHSERRQYFGETDEGINKKLHVANKEGLIPIVCIGETLTQREKNETFSVIEKQIKTGIAGLDAEQAKKLVVAYEPVWAIGTGKTATPQQAEEVHAFIRKLYSEIYGKDAAECVRILYGGSVKPNNISEIMKQPNIDGGLIGGASLKADDFIKLVRY